jgi:hypothetical protein
MKSATSIVLALCCLLLASPHAGAVPQTINYQGFLTTSGGAPVDATVAMTFRLYAAESGGVALWSETKPAVAVSNGIFSVVLGSTMPIQLPFDAPYWIGVTVNADDEMTPRQPAASSPYAFRAAIADAVAPVAACPTGMTRVALDRSILCFAAASSNTWDTADQFCYQSYRSGICTLAQWRNAVCQAGLPNPGASWTSTPVGIATFATVSGCTGESVGSSAYNNQRIGTCCLEWMKY